MSQLAVHAGARMRRRSDGQACNGLGDCLYAGCRLCSIPDCHLATSPANPNAYIHGDANQHAHSANQYTDRYTHTDADKYT